MWCPTTLVVKGKETKYPVPEPHLPLNFTNSTGMRYEAEEVRQCLLKGTVGLCFHENIYHSIFFICMYRPVISGKAPCKPVV